MAEFFDVMNSVSNKREVSPEDVNKHFTGFLYVRNYSIHPQVCYKLNFLNSAQGLNYIPKIAEYKFIRNSVPRGANFKFDKKDKNYEIIVDAIMDEFMCGYNTAEEYMKMLGGRRIMDILNKRAMIDNPYVKDSKILALREAINKKEKEIKQIKELNVT